MNHVQSVDIYTPTYMKRYPDSSGQIMPKQCTYINPFILASPLIQNTGYFTDLLILALACSSQNSRKIKDPQKYRDLQYYIMPTQCTDHDGSLLILALV